MGALLATTALGITLAGAALAQTKTTKESAARKRRRRGRARQENISEKMSPLPLRHQRREKNRAGIEGHRQALHLHGEQRQSAQRNAESVDRKWRFTHAA